MKKEGGNIVFVGDFNAQPDSKTYQHFIDSGYLSAFKQINGKEPDTTFPTGLQAEFMDTDPAATFDYIFYKGDGITPKSCIV